MEFSACWYCRKKISHASAVYYSKKIDNNGIHDFKNYCILILVLMTPGGGTDNK